MGQSPACSMRRIGASGRRAKARWRRSQAATGRPAQPMHMPLATTVRSGAKHLEEASRRGTKAKAGIAVSDEDVVGKDDTGGAPILVIINRMNGESLEFDVPGQSTVADLKEQLLERLHVPPILQVLLMGSKILTGSSNLASFLYDGCDHEDCLKPRILPLMLLVSYSQDDNFSKSWSVIETRRQDAVALVDQLGWVHALACVAEDLDSGVRQAALEALGALAIKGDERAVHAVSAGLEDISSFVRRAALQSFPKIANKGDEHALTLITKRLWNSHPGARHNAVEALSIMTQKGDSSTVKSLIKCLDDDNFGVRIAAVRALSSVANASDARVISALQACAAQDRDTWVRGRAAKAVRQLSRDSLM